MKYGQVSRTLKDYVELKTDEERDLRLEEDNKIESFDEKKYVLLNCILTMHDEYN